MVHPQLHLHPDNVSLSTLLLHALQNKLPQKKGSSSSILMQNQSELTIDAAPVFHLMSRISSDPLRIRTTQSRDSLGHKQTTPRLAHYIGNGWMTQGECIPSKSPIHTTSLILMTKVERRNRSKLIYVR